MFGALMGPTADAQPADLENKWLQTLQSPETQRMLLTFGTQLMTPRWSGASALPDAINAVGRNEAAIEQEDYNREKADTDRQTKIDMNNSDNAAALKRTQIAADNRSEVANIRGEYGLQIQNARENFKRELLSGKMNEHEQKIFREHLKAGLDDILNNRGDNATRQANAEKRARDAVTAYRLQFGGGDQAGAANAGGITSANPSPGSAPASSAKPGEAGKFTSANPSNEVKYSTNEALKKLKDQGVLDKLLQSPDAYQKLAPIVSDPDYLKRYLELLKRGQ